jgi:hypothetical protein
MGQRTTIADTGGVNALRSPSALPCLALASLLVVGSACTVPLGLNAGADDGPTLAPSPSVPSASTLPAQLRLLSAAEYRETVRDLLHLEVAPHIDHTHLAGGFDTGADGQLHEALFATLLDEAERLGRAAVTTTLAADFACVGVAVDDDCARAVIASLARRAARRPVDDARVDELVAFFAAERVAEADATAALANVVTRLLLSPEFLYRAEVGVDVDNARALDAFEQASLVSFAVTGAPPDVALFDDAVVADAVGARLDDDTLRRHVARLLDTPRGHERVAALVRQWVRATALDDMVRRPEDFPKLASPEQGRALKEGFDAFVDAVAYSDDGSLQALFSSPFAMVNRHSAGLVGADVDAGDDLVRVELPRSERRGLLTQPGWLAALGASGEPDKDRPVLRGYAVKTQLLCEPIGPPSGLNTAAASQAAAEIPGFNDMTTRQQYEAMMEQGASCSACHAQFMPLGFAFGRYDALGRHRTEQRGQTVDPSTSDVPFLGEPRSFADGLVLSDVLAEEPVVADCFAQNAAAFVTGLGSSSSSLALGAEVAAQRAGRAEVLATLTNAVVRAASAPRAVHDVDDGDDVPVDDGDDGDDVPVDDGDDGGDGDDVVVDVEVVLGSGAGLAPGESRSVRSGAFTFSYQSDGNLVLYESGVPRWASFTNGESAHTAIMQGDGNLVVYSRPGAPVFHTGTNGNAGAVLVLRADGVLEVRGAGGVVLHTLAHNVGTPGQP